MKIEEKLCKTILVPSKLPDADYVVNPYTGCSFACAYCYASFMGRFVGQPIEAWGSYLSVKTNAVEVFQKDLDRLPEARRNSTILLSSVTDAWQGPEKKYRLTQGIMQALVHAKYQGVVSMLTKSPLVTRDIPIIADLKNKEVGVTVTTTDDALGKFLEMQAPNASDRLKTLETLNRAGIPTYAFIGPLLPHYRYRTDQLEEIFRALADAGTSTIFAEHLNTSQYIRKRLDPLVVNLEPESRDIYASAQTQSHRDALSEIVLELVEKYRFHLRLGHVIDHHRDKKRAQLS